MKWWCIPMAETQTATITYRKGRWLVLSHFGPRFFKTKEQAISYCEFNGLTIIKED